MEICLFPLQFLDTIQQSKSKIIIMDVYAKIARNIMCEAYRRVSGHYPDSKVVRLCWQHF